MRYIIKKVITVSFSRPKMEPVFGLFFGLILIKIELEMKHNDFTNLEFIALPRKKDFVFWNEGQYTLLIFGELIFDANPVQFE